MILVILRGQFFQIHFYDSIATGLVAAIELVVFTAVISWELIFSFFLIPGHSFGTTKEKKQNKQQTAE